MAVEVKLVTVAWLEFTAKMLAITSWPMATVAIGRLATASWIEADAGLTMVTTS